MKQLNRIRIYYSGTDMYHEFDTTMAARDVAAMFESRVTPLRRFINWWRGVDPDREFACVANFGDDVAAEVRVRDILEIYSRVREVRSVVRMTMGATQRKTT